MALEKGTEEWMFWRDFFQLCKKYWEIKDTEEYWRNLVDDANELCEKYEIPFINRLLIAFLNMQNDKYQASKNK